MSLPVRAHPSFTLAAASATLPRVRGLIQTVIGLRLRLKEMYQRLDQLGHPPGETLPWGAPTEAINLHAVYAAMAETLREHADAVRDTGAVIRDIEVGLVDWRAHTPSTPNAYWWSWRLGEANIASFRDAADDADRRPLGELPAAVLAEAMGRAPTADPEPMTDSIDVAAEPS